MSAQLSDANVLYNEVYHPSRSYGSLIGSASVALTFQTNVMRRFSGSWN